MKRTQWSVNLRNRLSSIAMECDSSAAIEGAKMTPLEQETLQKKIRSIVSWIDKRIIVKSLKKKE